MVRAGTGVSAEAAAPAAGAEAVSAALAALGGEPPSLAVVAATPHHTRSLEKAVSEIAARIGEAQLVGATVEGVLAPGIDLEQGPGLGVLLVSGVEAHSFLVHDVTVGVDEEISQALPRASSPEDLLLLLFDPTGCDLRALLDGASAGAGRAVLVGAGATDAGDGAARVFAAGEVARGSLAGVWLRATGRPRVGVAQSCRNFAGPFKVTRTDGNWVLGLDGRPALDVYREVARAPLAEDLRRALSFVLAAVPHGPGAVGESGAYVVRHLAGVSERRRAFALPEATLRGQSICFVLRDAAGAREDLREMLDGMAAPPAAFGLYLGCRERGASLFGVAGLEAAYLERTLPGVPVLGLSGPCEIGPVGDGFGLLTHAAVLALVSG